MEFIDFDSLLAGIRDSSIAPGFMFTHYNGDVDEEWEFSGEQVLSFADPSPVRGGWWSEPYQGHYVYRIDDDLVFLDHSSEGDGDDYAIFLGKANSPDSLNQIISNLIVELDVEMHFALEHDFRPKLIPAEYLELFQVAVDSAWMRSSLPIEQISQIAVTLTSESRVYRAFRSMLAQPASAEWRETLHNALKQLNFSEMYEKFKPGK